MRPLERRPGSDLRIATPTFASPDYEETCGSPRSCIFLTNVCGGRATHDAAHAGAYSLDGLCATTVEQGVVLAARDGDSVIGAAVAELVGSDLSWYDAFGPDARARLVAARAPGSLGGAAVIPAWRGRGVGAQLQAAMTNWLASHGCDVVVAVAWLHPGPGQSAPLLERSGLRRSRAPRNSTCPTVSITAISSIE